jgi:thiamine-phosphate pyrophosphorylase
MHNFYPKMFYFINELNIDYIRKLNKNISIIYRNYNNKIDIDSLQIFKNLCKKQQRKFYLSNDIRLAIKEDLDGVYLPSFNQTNQINFFNKKKKFIILGSAHNIREIKIKEKQKASLIFISPIFKSNKNKKILDINKFNILTRFTKKKIIALGGINENNLKKINKLNCYGFAAITFFKKHDNVNLLILNKNG